MLQHFTFDRDILRKQLADMDQLFPGAKNEELADTVVGLLEGKIQFKDIQGLTDNHMEAVYTVAYNAIQAGSFVKAEKLFRFLVMFDNSKEKYWNGLGLSRFKQENYEDALHAYSMSTLLNVDDPKAPMRLAECHIALGDKETAAGAYEVALEIAGDKPEFATERRHAQAVLDLLRK